MSLLIWGWFNITLVSSVLPVLTFCAITHNIIQSIRVFLHTCDQLLHVSVSLVVYTHAWCDHIVRVLMEWIDEPSNNHHDRQCLTSSEPSDKSSLMSLSMSEASL